jgi:hypothetical protein
MRVELGREVEHGVFELGAHLGVVGAGAVQGRAGGGAIEVRRAQQGDRLAARHAGVELGRSLPLRLVQHQGLEHLAVGRVEPLGGRHQRIRVRTRS